MLASAVPWQKVVQEQDWEWWGLTRVQRLVGSATRLWVCFNNTRLPPPGPLPTLKCRWTGVVSGKAEELGLPSSVVTSSCLMAGMPSMQRKAAPRSLARAASRRSWYSTLPDGV